MISAHITTATHLKEYSLTQIESNKDSGGVKYFERTLQATALLVLHEKVSSRQELVSTRSFWHASQRIVWCHFAPGVR